MSKRITPKKQELQEGIVLETSLELLRKAAKRVLFEFTEGVVSKNGDGKPLTEEVELGDAVVFREDMDFLPGEIVAVKISATKGQNAVWYVMSTSEIPKSGFPTAKDAMKAADSEAKRLRILTEFLSREAGVKVKDVHKWEPDRLVDAGQVLAIIADAGKRYGHMGV
ncbi:MAG: hypothetical protein C4K49_10120 [Candidatus Thorarchaeota archaeon]|nr:MAG: hypothetical protein C4K49_10120 [Candidatus Thorarchaeota archaeon]